ncbi:MAG: HAD hydrolase family protein [Mogibacterium sp.]|nr:HAD hydrolase family protein [Mogibacterium sp.]
MVERISFFVMDVDGTLTDGKIYMGSSGEVMKAFNIKDGYGIHDKLLPNNIVPVIITGRQSAIVENRCNELGISEVHQGVLDKLSKLQEIVHRYNKSLQDVAYIGDDLNDLTCMKTIKAEQGLIGCPADADKELIQLCDFVSAKNGGEGAVREFIDYILGPSAV